MSRTRNEIDAQRAANAPAEGNPFATLQDFYDVAVDLFFPVGTIIYRDSEQNPNTDYPGTTWVEFGGGRVLMSRNATYARGWTGGAATHTLSWAEMPAHTHTVNPPNTLTGNNNQGHTHSGSTGNESATHTHSGTTNGVNANHTHPQSGGVLTSGTGVGGGTSYAVVWNAWTGNNSVDHLHGFTSGGQSANHTHGFTTGGASSAHNHYVDIAPFASDSAGSSAAHNNIQPSIAVVVWKRTA